jgi:Zn-finger nucleic acid-binding protein
MERARFNQKAAIVVDVCPKHGVWLDAGELPRLLDYLKEVADGNTGLDETDRADQQHWDHVMNERLNEERIVDANIAAARARADAHRTRNVMVGTALGGPWVGLFMAMRGGGRPR